MCLRKDSLNWPAILTVSHTFIIMSVAFNAERPNIHWPDEGVESDDISEFPTGICIYTKFNLYVSLNY